MRIVEACTAFQGHLEDRGLDRPEAEAVDVLASMIDWYVAERAADAAPMDEDGDMLLFQWGTHDWGQGTWFEIDLTRQLALASEMDDDAIWQLSLTFRYTPDEGSAAPGKGHRWCGDVVGAPEFRRCVEGHAVTDFARRETAAERDLRYENTG